SDWDTPWDNQISRIQADLSWRDGALWVRHRAEGRNPIFFKGISSERGQEFAVRPGEYFVIGRTTFSLEEDPPPPEELTLSPEELRSVRYMDADERIEALAKLPTLIRSSPSDQDLESCVLEVLLKGLPRAEAAGIVALGAGPTDE